MDLSALIFVALAVAWAVYLIPKALKHHDEVKGSRSVEKFSDSMRVLARREPVSKREARLVLTPGRPGPSVAGGATTTAPTREQVRARHAVAKRAAKRRLRVVALILLANVVVGVLAGLQIVAWPYVGIPAAVLLAWLVACRLMVRSERRDSAPQARLPVVVEDDEDEAADEGPVTEEIAPVATSDPDPERTPGSWDPVPVTLPTYVDKAPATRRTVRTIDLDSTGVWTSGRSETDSLIAREAEATERATRSARAEAEKRRAAGS